MTSPLQSRTDRDLPDASNGTYIIFMIIGIIGYFKIPTVSEWIIQARGAGNYGKNVNSAASYAGGKASGATGAAAGAAGGNIAGRLMSKGK